VTVGLFAVGDAAYALLVNRDYVAMTQTDVVVASPPDAVRVLDVESGTFVPVAGATTFASGSRFASST
jgi:hypothetical protein